jgi:hypothetical protein
VRAIIFAAALAVGLAGCTSVVSGAGSVPAGHSAPGASSSGFPSTTPSAPVSTGPSSSAPSAPTSPAGPAPSGSSPLRRYRGDRFSILLPGVPITGELPLHTKQGTITAHVLSVETGPSEAYLVAYSDYPPTILLSLEGAVRGAAAKTGGQALAVRRIVYRNHPGRDFRVETATGITAFIRIVVVGHRLYQVQFLERGVHAAPPAQYLTVRGSLRF